jgi:hypothetical protein
VVSVRSGVVYVHRVLVGNSEKFPTHLISSDLVWWFQSEAVSCMCTVCWLVIRKISNAFDSFGSGVVVAVRSGVVSVHRCVGWYFGKFPTHWNLSELVCCLHSEAVSCLCTVCWLVIRKISNALVSFGTGVVVAVRSGVVFVHRCVGW